MAPAMLAADHQEVCVGPSPVCTTAADLSQSTRVPSEILRSRMGFALFSQNEVNSAPWSLSIEEELALLHYVVILVRR
jgi:hypothetical protein